MKKNLLDLIGRHQTQPTMKGTRDELSSPHRPLRPEPLRRPGAVHVAPADLEKARGMIPKYARQLCEAANRETPSFFKG